MTSPRAPSTELLVVGGGVMGAWTAFWSRRAGMSTTLVDAYGPGNARATSGDESRIIRSSHGLDAFYTRWSRAAREHWIRFGEEWAERLFVQAGTLWFAQREDGFEVASEGVLRAEGIPVEHLSTDEMGARWPEIETDGLAFGLFEPEGGLLLARKSVIEVVRAFERLGGRVESAALRPGRVSGGRLLDVVAQDGGRRSADTFVFACGPWLPRLFPELLGDMIRVTKQDLFYFGLPAGGLGLGFASEAMPTWVDYDGAFYGIPAIEGRGFKVGPDRYGPVFDPTLGERIVDPESARLARSYLARRFPSLAAQPIVETRVCQYEVTPDTHFIIDRHPELENVWVVGGGSGHGFKHGPVIGEYVTKRVSGLQDGGPTEPDEERFSLGPRPPDDYLRTAADSMAATWQEY